MTVAEPPSKPEIQEEEDTTLATMAVAEPPKKPQSAYFIFSGEQRQAIKEELLKTKDKVSMGEVAKAISVKWKALTDEEKGAYQTQAAAQKEAYRTAKALEEANAGGREGDGEANDDVAPTARTARTAPTAPTAPTTSSALPLSMVKKLATSDNEVTRISGDALKVITEATGMFLGSLATRSMELALGNKKKNFKFEDVARAARRDPRLVDVGLVKAFEEQEPFKGWLAAGGASNKKRTSDAGGAGGVGGKKKAVAVGGGIAAFFTKAADAGEAEEAA